MVREGLQQDLDHRLLRRLVHLGDEIIVALGRYGQGVDVLRGAIINRAAQDIDALTVSTKRHNDFVTEVDQAAEQAVIQILMKAFPDHAILAEESGAHGKSDFVWIIDPLDGTTNFIHGFPQYCVSIGLRYKGAVTQAVIYDPGRNCLLYT